MEDALNTATPLIQHERFRDALTILEAVAASPEARWRTGQAWLGIGDLPRAVDTLRVAQTELTAPAAYVECGIDLAIGLTRTGRWQEALDGLAGLAPHVAALDDARLHLLHPLAMARANLRSGKPDAFLNAWESIEPQLLSQGLKREWILGVNLASQAHCMRGDWQRAKMVVEACLHEIASGTLTRSVALLAYQRTIIGYYETGSINEMHLHELMAAVEKSDGIDLKSDALFLQGISLWAQGNWKAAREAFTQAHTGYLQWNNLLDADLACISIARIDFDQADFAGALAWVARAESSRSGASTSHWAAGWAGLIEGWVHGALGNDAYAAARLEAGWVHFIALPHHDLAAFCALQLADLSSLTVAEQQTWLARAGELAAKSSSLAYRIMAERARGERLLAMNDAAGARVCLAQALDASRAAGVLPEYARIAAALVECELALAQDDGALNAVMHSAHARQHETAGFPELQARLSLVQAQIARRQNHQPAALSHLRAAALQVRWMRSLAGDPALSGAIANSFEAIHSRGLALAMVLNDTAQAVEFSESRRAQWLARRITLHKTLTRVKSLQSTASDSIGRREEDALAERRRALHAAMQAVLFGGTRASENQDAVQQAYAELNAHAMASQKGASPAAWASDVLDVDGLRAAFSSRFGSAWTAVLIEPATDEVHAWLLMCLTPGDMRIERIVATNLMDRTAIAWLSNPRPDWRRQMLAQPDKVVFRQRVSALLKLDTWLPADAPPHHTIIFAGCEPFNAMPLPAMVFADGRLLTERAVIRYTPAWHVAAQLCQATRRDWRMNASALLVAPAHFQGRHAALPASLKEVQDLQMLWPNHQALLETHATAAAIQALNMQGGLAQFDVVHFATHVQFDPLWSRLSGLALHDCDLWLQDVLDWRLDAQIVCVSGCEAARGAAVGGEEFLGFEAAMIAAGARNVLSPQWHVADTFAHAFIIDVMQRCRQHGDLALALAEAQRASIFTPPPLQWAGWRVFGMG